MTPLEQLSVSVRLMIKTIMGNAIPIVWLFELQPLLNVQFDGTAFWCTYGAASLVASGGMWYVNRTIPDPTFKTTCEVSTPILGVVAAVFQPAVFSSVLAIYFWIA